MTTQTVTVDREQLADWLYVLETTGSQEGSKAWNRETKAITAIREALAEQPDLDAICQDLQEKTYNQAMRIAELEAQVAQPAVAEQHKQEPFGYFKPEPFGWTDCAETDEGAIALYEKPQPCPTCEALARTVMMDQSSTDQQQHKPLTDEQTKLATEAVDQIMKQAQVFAAAWSLVIDFSSRVLSRSDDWTRLGVDFGNAMEDAEQAKAELQVMVKSLAQSAVGIKE